MSQVLKDKTFLNTFWSLAEDEIDNRVKGGSTLVNILIEQQRIHEKGDVSEKLSPAVKYALKRLVRGLASPRQSARQGFASTLTEVLDRIRAIHLTDVFELMDLELDIESKTIEARELIFGNIFAYHAIIQTQRITREKGSIVNRVVREMKKLSKQKSYLHDISYLALIDLVKKISENVFSKHVWPDVKSEFRGWDQSKPNAVALLSVCRERFPQTVAAQYVEEKFGHQDIFHKENFKQIQKLFVEAAVHNLNCLVFEDVLTAHLLKNRKQMKEFWNEVIENGLCLDDSYACVHIFTVLERLLPHCKEKDIPELFSPKIAEFLLDKLAKRKDKGRIRQELVSFTLRLPSLVAAFSTASKQLSVLRCLFSSPAYIHFDAITRTKTLANMISSLNGEGIKMYLEWLKELFFKETESADFAGVRRWICRQMLTLMKNPNVPREEGWMMEAAQFFFLHAFFEVKNQANYPPITGDLREEIAQHFYSAVEILSNSPPFHAEPDLRLHGVAPDGTLRAYKLVNHAKTLLSSDSVECLTPFSEEVQEAWETMLSTVNKIHKKYSEGTSATAGLAFQLLFLQVGLQTFREPEQCAEILEDLQLCFEKAMGKKDKLKKKTDEPEWMEVIVEILISLLARSSHLLRTVVEHSFKIICSNLTESSLQLILDMFDPDKQKLMSLLSFDGDEESDGEDEELIEEDAAREEDGEGGENKILNGKKSKTEDDVGDEDSDSSDDDDDDEDEDEETAPVDAAFRKEVMNALGDAGVLKQQEDDSDSDLNDEAMAAFDDTLADVFRTKKKKNQKFDAKLNEETVVHFKLRAFQLLDIFIKKNPDSPLLIKMVYPLLVIAGTVKGQRDAMILAERAAQLLEIKFFKAKKYPHSISKKDVAYISETLEKLMDRAKQAHSLKTVTQVSHCCTYMVKVMNACHNNEKMRKPVELDGIKTLYSSALADFMTKRSTNLQPVLFLNLIQKVPEVAWLLVEEFAEYINTGLLTYRQIQACVMLSAICKAQFKGSESEHTDLVTTVQKSLNKALSNVLENSNSSKPKFVREILVAVQQFSVFAHRSTETPNLSQLVSSLEKMKATFKTPVFIASVVQNSINAALNQEIKNKRKRKRGKKDRR